jgi:uncharacterized protein YjiS (DUF1127 family)
MLLRSHAAHAAHTPWLDLVRSRWGAMKRVANHTWRNAVTRNELAELDDHMLADIGVTRGAALAEMDRAPVPCGNVTGLASASASWMRTR